MSSIGASYANLHVMKMKQKEKMKKKEKERQSGRQEARNLSVETSFATGKISNKIYPSCLSYNEQITIKSQY
ncbi:hypothetical protein AALP_AA7G275200 [Arabis alpina]|uniref:Uncharacterized protein n=1 Tax=Arabis alpina TaxID=50452 RepID=A0A087GKY5_ARAAL|nr:hypothetical protein AALP_AA7G275200 [Arabis alpina]